MLQTKKKLIGAVLLGVVALAWAGAFLALVLYKPDIAQWTLIVTAAAVVTEVAMWMGVALLGITALDKLRIWTRLRRAR